MHNIPEVDELRVDSDDAIYRFVHKKWHYYIDMNTLSFDTKYNS